MNAQDLHVLLTTYSTTIGSTGIKTPKQIVSNLKMKFGIPEHHRAMILDHIYATLLRMKKLNSEDRYYLRYLGFVKGILWALGSGTLERIESVPTQRYEAYLRVHCHALPEETDPESRLVIVFTQEGDRSNLLAYALGTLNAMQDVREQNEKNLAYIMLGMSQAFLWICGIYSLEELRKHVK